MNEYGAILAYAGFALVVFAFAMMWLRYRATIQKRFRLLNYRPKDDDPKAPHQATSQP